MPILGIMASAVSGNLTPTTGFVSISTVTVGSGGSAAITFSGIPQVYKHLQIRGILRGSATTTSNDQVRIRFNDDSANNYAYHMLLGSGSAATSSGTATQPQIIGMQIVGSGSTANVFGAGFVTPSGYAASDASVTVDGISYTRQSNAISDIVPGLTLSLKATSSTPASVNLARDTSALKAKLTALVTAYNDFDNIIKETTNPKSTLETYGATLVGDSTARMVRQQMRSLIFGVSSTPGTTYQSMSQLGFSLDQTGVLSLDETKLDTALQTGVDDIAKMFTGGHNKLSAYSTLSAGIAGDAVKKLSNMLGKTGILITQSESADTQNTKYKAELTKLQTRMDALLLRYQKQFSSMDSLVGNVNSQKTSLKSTFEGMMASLTGKSG
jgi:flagellar hook-associated protein 2